MNERGNQAQFSAIAVPSQLASYIATNESIWPRELRQKATNALCAANLVDRPDQRNEVCERLNRADLKAFLDAITAR